MIVGISGKMQSGKDAVADRLVTRYGFKKVALADPLKHIASEHLGWSGEKDNAGRHLLQKAGTETAKSACGDTVWVDILHRYMMIINKHHEGNINFVIPDIRFICEAEWVTGKYAPLGFNKLKDGFLVSVERKSRYRSTTGDSQHRSEVEMNSSKFKSHINTTINNVSSLEELYNNTDSLYDELVTRVYNLPR